MRTLTTLLLLAGLAAPVSCSSDPPDVSGDCDAPCELISQCGCSDGAMCTLTDTAAGTIACIDSGTATAGELCGLGQCSPGFHCAGLNGLEPTCRKWCDPAATEDVCAGAGCTLDVGDLTTSKLCGDVCNPLTDEGCRAEGSKCVPSPNSALCLPAGTGMEGAACTDQADCANGLNCFGIGNAGPSCRTYCAIGGQPCAQGFTCEAFADTITVDGTDLGACIPQG